MPTTRRAILTGACAALLAACGRKSADSAPAAAGDSAATPDTDTPPPPCAQGAPGSDWLALPLADHPDLGGLYGSAVVQVSGRAVIVAQVDVDCYVALDQVCTHEGCAIEYRDNNRFVCPCHGALFGFTGEVLGGPAPRPVPVHAAVREGDTVWVNPTPEAR